jgi:hypothetical protein
MKAFGILGVVLLVALPAAARESKRRWTGKAVVSARAQPSLHQEPRAKSGVITKLKPGTRLVARERTRRPVALPGHKGKFRWYKVQAGSRTGWVWGGALDLDGQRAEKRAWRRTPSATPAEAKEKGLTRLPRDLLKRLLASYSKRMKARRAKRSRGKASRRGVRTREPRSSQTTRSGASSSTASAATAATRSAPLASATTASASVASDAPRSYVPSPWYTPSLPKTGEPTPSPSAPAGGRCSYPDGFTYYNQGDPRWKDEKLGNSSNTIGGAGCCLTSWAMLVQFYGARYTPPELNLALKEQGGFNGDLMLQGVVGSLVGKIVVDSRDTSQGWERNHERALAEIAKNFQGGAGAPMVLQVDYLRTDDDYEGDHFVLISCVDEAGDPIIWDPGSTSHQGVPLSKITRNGGYLPLRVLVLR